MLLLRRVFKNSDEVSFEHVLLPLVNLVAEIGQVYNRKCKGQVNTTFSIKVFCHGADTPYKGSF